jgi:hypothetical protein
VASGLTLLVTRLAALALAHTGLSREAADFQARSALTGTGFTTREAEAVVNHPLRRRIVLHLMLLGGIGIVSVLASVLVTFLQPTEPRAWPLRLVVLGGGIAAIWALAASPAIDRVLARLVAWAMRRLAPVEVHDYRRLLGLEEGYAVGELAVQEGDWLARRTLREVRLRDEGIQVLAVQRAGGPFLGVPGPETRLGVGDTLVLYGDGDALEGLADRLRGHLGDRAHAEAVRNHQAREQAEAARDQAHARRRGDGGTADGDREASRESAAEEPSAGDRGGSA